jgi:hypothetical protein
MEDELKEEEGAIPRYLQDPWYPVLKRVVIWKE